MEKLSFGPKPRIYHLGWAGELAKPGRLKHDGVLTLAVREEAPQVLVVGFTFCAPTDQFDKAHGRQEAMRRMNDMPLRFRFIGNPFVTLEEVVRCLCTMEFEELGHFCGEHLDFALFSTKFVPVKQKGGEETEELQRVCRVPAWAGWWWLKWHPPGDVPALSIGKLADLGIKVEIHKVPKQSEAGMILERILASKGMGPHLIKVRAGGNMPPELTEVLDKMFQEIREGRYT